MTENIVKGDSVPQNNDRRNNEWKSHSITELIKALVAFQGGLSSVGKGKTNPFFNSSYADINDILVANVKKDAQAVGSSITYGRRYGLSAILGISVEADDDGNKAIKS